MVTLLPEGAPSEHGVDAGGIGGFLDAVDNTGLHSLMILRHGQVIASGWWAPYGPDRPHHLYSLSKSFTSTAAGLAAAEGLLDLDAPVLGYFPELDGDVTDPRSRAMLVRHIASMSSGHLADTWEAAVAADPGWPVRGFLRLPPERDPGTVFAYNQSCTYTLASIIQRVTGQPLIAYLRPRLFDAIGIGPASWDEFPPGQALGFAGCYATTDAIARLGELYLRGGQWNGRQVIPAEWVAEATRSHIASSFSSDPDWQQGYGFHFWMSRHGYRGDGAFGQFCLVLPQQDAVVAITAGTYDMQGILDAVWDHLLPAFGAAAGGAEADAALAKRLRGLQLPPAEATLADWPVTDSAPVVLTPAEGAGEVLPSVRRVHVANHKVTLFEDDQSVELRLAAGEWTVTEEPVPVAASGGWTSPDTLAADVIFLETPHRLSLTCSVENRTFTASWYPRPFVSISSLSRLASPASS